MRVAYCFIVAVIFLLEQSQGAPLSSDYGASDNNNYHQVSNNYHHDNSNYHQTNTQLLGGARNVAPASVGVTNGLLGNSGSLGLVSANLLNNDNSVLSGNGLLGGVALHKREVGILDGAITALPITATLKNGLIGNSGALGLVSANALNHDDSVASGNGILGGAAFNKRQLGLLGGPINALPVTGGLTNGVLGNSGALGLVSVNALNNDPSVLSGNGLLGGAAISKRQLGLLGGPLSALPVSGGLTNGVLGNSGALGLVSVNALNNDPSVLSGNGLLGGAAISRRQLGLLGGPINALPVTGGLTNGALGNSGSVGLVSVNALNNDHSILSGNGLLGGVGLSKRQLDVLNQAITALPIKADVTNGLLGNSGSLGLVSANALNNDHSVLSGNGLLGGAGLQKRQLDVLNQAITALPIKADVTNGLLGNSGALGLVSANALNDDHSVISGNGLLGGAGLQKRQLGVLGGPLNVLPVSGGLTNGLLGNSGALGLVGVNALNNDHSVISDNGILGGVASNSGAHYKRQVKGVVGNLESTLKPTTSHLRGLLGKGGLIGIL